MPLTFALIRAVTGLSLSQARRLVREPYPVPTTKIRSGHRGRPELAFSLAQLAPRLADFGLTAAIIAQLAIASISHQKQEIQDE